MATELHTSEVGLTDSLASDFLNGIHSRRPVTGLTHNFYRYPARFSPLFSREAIKAFTQVGDIVLDPFMGGGTSLVEARALGRRAIGTDISELATFVSRVKTTALSSHDLSTVHLWSATLKSSLNLHNAPVRDNEWITEGYQRNIHTRSTWPIRKLMELALARIIELPKKQQQRFARCVLLRTGQWALDCRRDIPTAEQFRSRFFTHLEEMSEGAREFSTAVRAADKLYEAQGSLRTLCINRSAIGIENDRTVSASPTPKLILTSPPYPGVYILYHRWKVQGRKESPAPFWIADSSDGNGMSYYTMGDCNQKDLSSYYDQVLSAFTSIARLASLDTWLIQIVGFSAPRWQLPRYLDVMDQAGFSEIKIKGLSNSPDGRLWRSVPQRKWFAAYQQAAKSTSMEVVLFHRLKKVIPKPEAAPRVGTNSRLWEGFQIIF